MKNSKLIIWIIGIVTVLALIIGGVFVYNKSVEKKKANAKKQVESELEPDILRGVFDLATEKCYFSNVAEGKKTKTVAFLKKTINYWVEYTETIEIKVNLTKTKFGKKNGDSNTYIIYIPEAEVDENSATVDNNNTKIYVQRKGITPPWDIKVTSNDIEEAIKEANKETIEDLKTREDILTRARDRAKDYVKAYIKTFDIKDKYTVEFVDSVEEFEKKVDGADTIVFESSQSEDITEDE